MIRHAWDVSSLIQMRFSDPVNKLHNLCFFFVLRLIILPLYLISESDCPNAIGFHMQPSSFPVLFSMSMILPTSGITRCITISRITLYLANLSINSHRQVCGLPVAYL